MGRGAPPHARGDTRSCTGAGRSAARGIGATGNKMTAPVFVDTNVFVYASDNRETVKQPLAEEWLERLWRGKRGSPTGLGVLEGAWQSHGPKRALLPRADRRATARSAF